MPLLVLMAVALLAGGSPAAAPDDAPGVATEVVAVPPPTGVLSGRVFLKDGITGVPGADLSFSSPVYGTVEKVRTARDGRFKLRLPVGEYTLKIARRLDVYESVSVFTIPGHGRIGVDFLLLPDMERAPPVASARAAGDIGPDPRRTEPVVIGTVVDMMRPPDRAWSRRWAEALGFFGSVLAVALAAH